MQFDKKNLSQSFIAYIERSFLPLLDTTNVIHKIVIQQFAKIKSSLNQFEINWQNINNSLSGPKSQKIIKKQHNSSYQNLEKVQSHKILRHEDESLQKCHEVLKKRKYSGFSLETTNKLYNDLTPSPFTLNNLFPLIQRKNQPMLEIRSIINSFQKICKNFQKSHFKTIEQMNYQEYGNK